MSEPFGSGYSFVGDGASSVPLDQLIDPITGDYVRNDVGEWTETADSRTTMLLMIEIEFGGSPFDPSDGTSLKERIRAGDPITPEEVREETLRIGQVLESAGILTDLEVAVRDPSGAVLRDRAGRLVVQTSWRDLASGSPVDLTVRVG